MGERRGSSCIIFKCTYLHLVLLKKEPYTFETYIVLSRLYRLTSSDVASMMEEVENAPSPNKKKKRSKKSSAQSAEEQFEAGTFSFHGEDDQVQKVE